jgi:hypothetical protein
MGNIKTRRIVRIKSSIKKMINSIPYITQLLKIEPFKITCLWNTGEVRVNDFEEDFSTEDYLDIFYQLKNYELFKYASVSEEGTLQWVNLVMRTKILGKNIQVPFDLDPITLYEKSHSIKEYKLVMVEEFV